MANTSSVYAATDPNKKNTNQGQVDAVNAAQTGTGQPSAAVPSAEATSPQTQPSQQPQQSQAQTPQKTNVMSEAYIRDFYQQMQNQQNAQVDYTVEQAVQQLQRAQEDAKKGWQTQHNQVNVDEAQARDREVLYANARGDRGGITARQYNSIANTAAKNRMELHQQQQKLATDTARQIADLRAKGEFEKASAVLTIAQQQLAKLWELQQYEDSREAQERQLAMQEANLTGQYNGEKTFAAQEADRQHALNEANVTGIYNGQKTQAAQNADRQFALSEAGLTGMYNGEKTYAAQEDARSWAYDIAMQNIKMGIVPDASVLAAAGIDPEQADMMAYIYAQTSGNQMWIDAYNASKNGTGTGTIIGGYGGSYSGGGGSSGSKVTFDPNTDYQALINAAVKAGELAAAAQYEQQRNAKIDAMNKAGTNTEGYKKSYTYINGKSGGSSSGSDTPSYTPDYVPTPTPAPEQPTNPTNPNNPALSDTLYNKLLDGFQETLTNNDPAVGETLVANAYNTVVDNWSVTDEQLQGLAAAANPQNVDYMELIIAARNAGEYAAAAKYEQKRNDKIDAMNKAGTNTGGYQKTNMYGGSPNAAKNASLN